MNGGAARAAPPFLLAALVLVACASDPVTTDPSRFDSAHPAALHEITVDSEGVPLNAIVYVPQGPGPHPVVILLHGFPGNERNLDLAQALRRAGYAVLFFHYRGAWGNRGAFTLERAIEDVKNAVSLAHSLSFARAHRTDPSRIALVGHSMGGFLALTAGSELSEVDCIASLAGANLGVFGLALQNDPAVRDRMIASIESWRGPIRSANGRALVAEIEKNAAAFDTTGRAGALARKPLLLVAASRDEVLAPAQHHEPLVLAVESAGARMTTALVLESDHAFSDRRIALGHVVVDWLDAECR